MRQVWDGGLGLGLVWVVCMRIGCVGSLGFILGVTDLEWKGADKPGMYKFIQLKHITSPIPV